jgi:hypothetical protein
MVYQTSVGNPVGKRQSGRPSRRWENNNIRMDVKETGWEGVNWILVAQDRGQWWALMNTVINLRVPYKAGNFLTE